MAAHQVVDAAEGEEGVVDEDAAQEEEHAEEQEDHGDEAPLQKHGEAPSCTPRRAIVGRGECHRR